MGFTRIDVAIRGRSVVWTLLATVTFALVVALANPAGASAATPTLTVQPSKTQLAPGEEFEVAIFQDADFPTLGAQATMYFDPSILQVVSVQPGEPYADATFLLGVAPNVDQAAIDDANITGELANIATFLLPGISNVQPGHNLFANIHMRAKAGGASTIRLDGRHYQVTKTDGLGNHSTTEDRVDPIGFLPDPGDAGTITPANAVNSSVTVTGAGGGAAVTPAPGTTLTPRPTVSQGVTSPTATSLGAVASPGSLSLSLNPASVKVNPGETFSVSFSVNAPSPIKGGQLDLSFDKEVVSVVSVEPGQDWKTPSQGYDSLIQQANSSGQLASLIVSPKSGQSSIAAGNVTLFKITFKGLKDGSSDLKVVGSKIIDLDGHEIDAPASAPGQLTIGSGGGSSSLPLILGGFVVIGALGGGGFFVWNRRRKRWEG